VLSGENGEYLGGCLRLLACGEYSCASVSKAGAAGAAGTVRSDDIHIVHESKEAVCIFSKPNGQRLRVSVYLNA
jgi:hypothetical protein